MRKHLWKILNGLLGVWIAWLAFRSYASLKDFFLWVGSLIGLFAVVNFFALRRSLRTFGDYCLIFLPLFFLLGLFGAVAATTTLGIKLFLIIAGLPLFYFYQSRFPNRARPFLEDFFTLSTGFLILVFLWSLNFFFAPSAWVLSVFALGAFFLIFWQAFYKIGWRGWECGLWSLISTLILMEIVWAIFFWPVHFLTSAVMTFSGFYLIYVLARPYFEQTLTKEKIYFQTAIILVVVLLSLLSSSWQP